MILKYALFIYFNNYVLQYWSLGAWISLAFVLFIALNPQYVNEYFIGTTPIK